MELQKYKCFLKEYSITLKEANANDVGVISTIRFTNPCVTEEEIEGECLEWCLNFLAARRCPAVLAAALAHEVYCRISVCDLSDYWHEEEKGLFSGETSLPGGRQSIGQDIDNKEYSAEALHSFVLATLETVLLTWSADLPDLALPSTMYECSFHAIKNTRRNMEDRHVIVPDLNTLFGLKVEPRQSFYGVFDGHAGVTAAMFAARQLHCKLVRHAGLDTTNPAAALKTAIKMTDESFNTKARKMKWRSGSTCVSALIRDGHLHLAWLGDSQAVLVRGGCCVTHLEPHKPERQDERDRIEALGGCVMLVGDIWRVAGNLAVSRAIGDVGYKPFVSSDCDVVSVEMDGTEDYVVLACDGAWDAITYDTLPRIVYNYLAAPGNDRANVAKMLVQYAKDNDSTDNISVIVVFFREDIAVPKPCTGLFDFFGAGTSEADTSEAHDSNATGAHNSNTTGHVDNSAGDDKAIDGNGDQLQGDNHSSSGDDNQAFSCDVDLDYYGVFDTRLVDGSVNLPFLDMPNSSELLKGIAETMYSGQYDVALSEMHILQKNENKHQSQPAEQDMTEEQLYLTISPGKYSPKPSVDKGYEKWTVHKYSMTGLSPVCWAFTGKNRAAVQNYRLNQAAAAKYSMRRPIALSELSTAVREISKNDNVGKIASSLQRNGKSNILNKTRSYYSPSGMTIYGSKTNIQRETEKFHSSWRPKKPVKLTSTIVSDLPPSPFVQVRLDGLR